MAVLRRTVVVAALVAAWPGPAGSQPAAPRSPRNASYTLHATLTPATRSIEGRGRLTWRNAAGVPATELRFHMYWNAWRDPSSSWFREHRLVSRKPAAPRRTEDAGQIDLTALTLVQGETREDLLPDARYIAPDDGNEQDQTVLQVPLPRPAAPGETLELDLAWTARVPRPVARTGVLGQYYFIAHWFPKIGVFEDAGWSCHQFHAATEFYADYGAYDVSLTVPGGWIVGATGVERARVDNADGTATHQYVEADVHDFAWTTSPQFVDVRRQIEEPGRPPVDVRLLLQPEHADQVERHYTAVRATLSSYGRWFGPYPYGHLTVVDPVTVMNPNVQGNDTGGMEYPTLITAGARWVSPWTSMDPEGVIVHETGHQFWHGVVGTNEVEHAWMDEGVTTYVTARVIEDAFAGRFTAVERYFGGMVAWPFADVPWSRDLHGNRLMSYRSGPSWDAPAAPTWQYWPGTARNVTYAKTALWLTSLERQIGWDAMRRVLSTYYGRYAYRHPAPSDFFAVVAEVSGRDLTWFFDAVHRSAASFDYAVDQVTSEPIDDGLIRTTVVARRLADGVFPVDVRITFDDGSSVRERWNDAARWRAMSFVRTAAVREVAIDPDRVLTLDLNYTNNTWSARPRAREAAGAWALRWLTWAQTVLLTYAFFV
ncbi:MAG: M1 family metallopeptidase [Acidobacteria bacterium]|nr:M1 family metallopeptidase [Acidobacteriota bacterium]